MFIFYSLLLVMGSCFSPVSIASYDITILYPESSGFLPLWPKNLKSLSTRLMTLREASAEGTLVKNQWWSTRISLAHFCTFQISLNLIIGCVYSEDLELVYHSAIEFKCPWQIGMSIHLNGIIFYFFIHHCKWY